MESETWIQIRDILLCASALGKKINQFVFLLFMYKQKGGLGSLALVR